MRLGIRKVLLFISMLLVVIYQFSPAFSAVHAEEGDTSVSHDNELAVDLTAYPAWYTVETYNNTNGLPVSEVRAITRTDDGFIWIGGNSGLFRHDGKSFEQIGSKQGISNVLCLYVDSLQRLWIGTKDNGAILMYRDTQTNYDKSRGLRSLSIRAIAEDGKGNIYLATSEGIAVVAPDDGTLTFIEDLRINGKYISSLRKGADGLVFGLTNTGDIFRITDGAILDFVSSEMIPVELVTAILPDTEKSDCFYAGHFGEDIFYCRIGSEVEILKKIDKFTGYAVNSIEYIDGILLICADDGFYFLYGDDEYNFIPEIPTGAPVENVMTDFQGNLWITSSQLGVFKIVGTHFLDFYFASYMQQDVVNAVYRYKNDFYISSTNNGIMILDDEGLVDYTRQFAPVTDPFGVELEDNELLSLLYDHKLVSFFEDSHNRLWASGYGEYPLVCIADDSTVAFSQKDGIPSRRMRAVIERADGSFAAAGTGGLVIIRDMKVEKVYNEADGLNNTELLTIAENGSGELVIGTDGGGLYILGRNGLSHIGSDNGLSSDVVTRVKKDDTLDIIWILTSNSAAYMTADHQIVTLTDFPYSNTIDIFENNRGEGEMIILGSNGIYLAQKSEMLENRSVSTSFFDNSNGLPYLVTPASCSYLADDGFMYIAGQKGIILFDINNLYDKDSSIKMSVPYVEADGVRIYPDQEGTFVLGSDVKKLTINAHVCNYVLSDPEVTYWLEGFEEEKTTIPWAELAPVVYTNLKGQEYTFNMLHTADWEGNTETISVRIVKERALYEHLWFRIAVVGAAAAVILLITIVYVRHKMNIYRKKAEENRILVREIVEAFAKVIDMKDAYTNGHSSRVADYTTLLAKELGCDEDTVENYRNIALMHDIGKVGVPAEVLNKPGKLSDEEFHIIQSHSDKGYETLKGIHIMPGIAEGAYSHHERPDGKGYPRGLKGGELPRVAQIIAVADTFDAMYSNRPYRKRMDFDRAVSIIKEASGTQLTSDVVDAFLRLVEKGSICRAEDDNGNGTTENIDNIRKGFDK